MLDWNYTPEHAFSLTIAADARLNPTSYVNDQIWELNLGSSEPPALVIQTTFGLRARSCRIFPRFSMDGQTLSDPVHFHRSITIQKYYPNYIKVTCRPFSSINVEIEYWVPGSQAIGGRVKIKNNSHSTRHIQVDWIEHLIPSPDGERMSIGKLGLTTLLAGRTTDLAPVFYLTGGVKAGTGPYPSLSISFEIPPHSEQESRWLNASLTDVNSSFEHAKEIMNRNWDSEIARIQRINSQEMEIITGNHDWNTALFLANTIAHQLLVQPIEVNHGYSFVYSRNADQGYSIRKDGTDYNHLWNGQTAFDTNYLANFLLPSSPEILRDLLDNFVVSQNPQGEIDWKPGLGGQRSQLLSTPILASLAWRYYEFTGDRAFLEKIFAPLTNFYFSWFLNTHDRDSDSIPEWDQINQTGYEENPLFTTIYPFSMGLDITTVESPDLIAYLFREGKSLISIARLLGDTDVEAKLDKTSALLTKFLDQSWSDQLASYIYRDRDSHITNQGAILGVQRGSGILEIHQEFPTPIRPTFFINSNKERTHPIQVYIHGTTPAGAHRVDHIPASRMRWNLGTGFITSEYIYRYIEHVEIIGSLADTEVTVRSVDLNSIDQTLLLPLWARFPTAEKANVLVNLTILNKNKFLSSYGLRSITSTQQGSEAPVGSLVMNLPWISLILEGMVHYGMHKQAADVFSRFMKALLGPLRTELKFFQSFDCETGKPAGAFNSLSSLLPIGLFLKILGVDIKSTNKVDINFGNPFPWPVTIKYRGLTIVHHEKRTLLVFPDSQTITVDNSLPQSISLNN